jgi:hypothetical protein
VVLDLVEEHHATQAVFEKYAEQAVECICCNAPFDSIEQMAAKHGLELERFLEYINRAVDDYGHPLRGPGGKA